MRRVKLLLGGVLSLLLLWPPAFADSADNSLVVQASGFANDQGHAIAKLFQPGDDVLGPGRRQISADIRDARARLEFRDLPAGAYAIVVFHDENDNGRIDHNALRLPSEPLGFSNGFVPGLFTGPPSFDKLRFEHGAAMQHLEINVK